MGNQHADRRAKLGASQHFGPSTSEVAGYCKEYDVITRFLKYVGTALSLCPAVSPSSGNKVILQRLESKPDPVVGSSGKTFASDVLGPWLQMSGQSVSPSISQPTVSQQTVSQPSWSAPFVRGLSTVLSQRDARRAREEGKEDSAKEHEPPPTGDPPAPRRRLVGKQGVPLKKELHCWRFKKDRWLCVSCLTTTRKQQPDRTAKCFGFAPSLRELVADARGHVLMVSFFQRPSWNGCPVCAMWRP